MALINSKSYGNSNLPYVKFKLLGSIFGGLYWYLSFDYFVLTGILGYLEFEIGHLIDKSVLKDLDWAESVLKDEYRDSKYAYENELKNYNKLAIELNEEQKGRCPDPIEILSDFINNSNYNQ